jgi:deoxycytidine triphosphate deaminase
MQLSVCEAITKGMITEADESLLKLEKHEGRSSIDISIREILARRTDGQQIESTKIRSLKDVTNPFLDRIDPQETVYVLSKERLSVPPGYIAYVFLKNRLSQKGLLAFNTGIVDGGFTGPISTLLTNLSTKQISLKEIDKNHFFRVVFHKIDMTAAENAKVKLRKYSYEDYRDYRIKELLDLPQFFQNPEKIAKQIESALNAKALNIGLVKMGLLFTIITLLFILVPPTTQLISQNLFGINPINKDTWELHESIQNKKIEELTKELEALQKSAQKKTFNSLDSSKKINNSN